jgi:hypothetical protein
MMRPRPEPPLRKVVSLHRSYLLKVQNEPPVTTATSPLTSYRSCLLKREAEAIVFCFVSVLERIKGFSGEPVLHNTVKTIKSNVILNVRTTCLQRVAPAAVWPTRQSGWRAVRIHISFGFEVVAMPMVFSDSLNIQILKS